MPHDGALPRCGIATDGRGIGYSKHASFTPRPRLRLSPATLAERSPGPTASSPPPLPTTLLLEGRGTAVSCRRRAAAAFVAISNPPTAPHPNSARAL
eukprot:356917-Chlamydomonas_euryale.AAC.7